MSYPLCRAGDIILTSSSTWLGREIRTFTRDRGEAPSVVNHAAIVTQGGILPDAFIVEALAKVRRHTVWSEYGNGGNNLSVFRPLDMTHAEIYAVCKAAELQVGQSYGYSRIAAHLLDWVAGRVTFRKRAPVLFRRLFNPKDKPICSGLVGESLTVTTAFKVAALDFGIPGYAASPDDIWDFVSAPGNKYYECIRPLIPFPQEMAGRRLRE